jgi:MFS family permease
VISDAYPEGERGLALGRSLAIASLFLVAGPLLGGLIVEAASWRWVFLLNVPVAAAAIAVAVAVVRDPPGARAPELDLPGAAALTAGLAALAVAIVQGPRWGWGSPEVLALAAGGVAALAVWARVELRATAPLLPLRALRNRALVGALTSAAAMRFVVLGGLVYATLYLQVVLGLSPLESGLAMLPGIVPLLGAPLAGRLADRIGPRTPIVAGMAITGVALAALGLIAEAEEYAVVAPFILLYGIGSAVTLTPTTTAAVNAVGAQDRGLATGLVSEARQIGGLIGLAVMGAIVSGLSLNRIGDDLADRGAAGVETARIDRLAIDGGAASTRELRALGGGALEVARDGLLHGLRVAFIVAGVVCLVGAAACAATLGSRRS